MKIFIHTTWRTNLHNQQLQQNRLTAKKAITNQRVNVINIWIDSQSLSPAPRFLLPLATPICCPTWWLHLLRMHSNLQLILSVFLYLFLCLCSLWLSVEKCQKQFIIVSCENAISNFTCTNGQLRCTHCTKAAKETRALAQNPKPATTITTTTTTRLYRVTRGRRSVGQSQGRAGEGVEKVRVRTLVNCTICHCHRARLAFKNILRNYNVHVSH